METNIINILDTTMIEKKNKYVVTDDLIIFMFFWYTHILIIIRRRRIGMEIRIVASHENWPWISHKCTKLLTEIELKRRDG